VFIYGSHSILLSPLYSSQFVGPNGQPSWCSNDVIDPLNAIFLSTTNIAENTITNQIIIDETGSQTWQNISYEATKDGRIHGAPKDMVIPFTFYLIVSVIYTVVDIALSLGIWSAAGVGTPTEPRGRDQALRTIIWLKLIFMNFLLIIVLASGLYFVAEGRRTNYGCGVDHNNNAQNTNAVEQFEGSPWYIMYCVVMFTYAFELLFWPCITLNQTGRSLTKTSKKSRLFGHLVNKKRRHENVAACLGCCVKTMQICSCNRMGGSKIKTQNDLKDAAIAFMDFFNLDAANFDIVLSDVWLAMKMLGRIHREKKFQLSEQARHDKERNLERDENGQLVSYDNNAAAAATPRYNALNEIFAEEDRYRQEEHARRRSAIDNLHDEFDSYRTVTKTLLKHNNASDMEHLRYAAWYSHYAQGVYDVYRNALAAEGLIDDGLYNPLATSDSIDLSSCFQLSEFGFPDTSIVYGTFDNDIITTPYCILVDEKERTVVVAIVGSATLEDMVTDLQFSSSKMDRVAEVCGIENGSDMYCHRGMLAKCKWIYNDLTK